MDSLFANVDKNECTADDNERCIDCESLAFNCKVSIPSSFRPEWQFAVYSIVRSYKGEATVLFSWRLQYSFYVRTPSEEACWYHHKRIWTVYGDNVFDSRGHFILKFTPQANWVIPEGILYNIGDIAIDVTSNMSIEWSGWRRICQRSIEVGIGWLVTCWPTTEKQTSFPWRERTLAARGGGGVTPLQKWRGARRTF